MFGRKATTLSIFLFLSFHASNTLPQDYVQDTLAVRAILDANGLDTLPVKSVSDSSGGRIVKLNFFKKKITTLPLDIGNVLLYKISLFMQMH